MNYIAPVWLPGGNLQTIWPALYGRRVKGALPQYRRERWSTPDADFIDVDEKDGKLVLRNGSLEKWIVRYHLRVLFTR